MWSLFAQQGPGREPGYLYCHRPFVARLHYKHHTLDLLTGRKSREGVAGFLTGLGQIQLGATFNRPKVMHLAYELGHFFNGDGHLVAGHLPLAVEIEYLESRHVGLEELWEGPARRPRLRFLEVPSWKRYQEAFRRVQQELLAGNCYQANLTAPFYLAWDRKHRPSDFIRTLWADPTRMGAYAHATWFSTMGRMILSNSPECLVQRKGDELYSMPIKGTLPDEPGAWERMRASAKERGELNMITDLVRSDLSRVHAPVARVCARQRPLRVPGLVHQYSVVAAPVPPEVTWGRVLECLFPGGSVTGAPKRRVMRLLHQLEIEPRGMYCGSTWLAHRDTLAASINIRTAELNFSARELCYGAGGGITLLSEEKAEFEELMRKSESFLSPFLT